MMMSGRRVEPPPEYNPRFYPRHPRVVWRFETRWYLGRKITPRKDGKFGIDPKNGDSRFAGRIFDSVHEAKQEILRSLSVDC